MINWENHFAGCEVGRSLGEKFDTFLEEGLLDSLLPYIVKDAGREINFKVRVFCFLLQGHKEKQKNSSCTVQAMMSLIISKT